MFWTPNKRRVQRWMFGVRSGWWYSCFSFLFLKMSLFLAVPGPRCCAGFSLAAESRGYSVARLAGFPWRWFLLVWSVGPGARELQQLQRVGSVVVAHGLSCSAACGIFSDQGLNWCLLCWQADSFLLSRQGSSDDYFYSACVCILFWTFLQAPDLLCPVWWPLAICYLTELKYSAP